MEILDHCHFLYLAYLSVFSVFRWSLRHTLLLQQISFSYIDKNIAGVYLRKLYDLFW